MSQTWLDKARLHLEVQQAVEIIDLRAKFLALQQL